MLLQGKLVVIHGFGGIGKTAPVREVADWLTRTKMYDGACFVSFEHGGDAVTLLSRLAVFEDGANEDNLLAMREIPEDEWAKLRPALEQAALLTPEQLHEAIRFPFLRFHPVLAPYLRSQLRADNAALRERYARRYYRLANFLYHEDDHNPQAVRALAR